MAIELSRRDFVLHLTALTGALLSLNRCSSILLNTKFADALINDRSKVELQPIIHALIRTFVPLEEIPFRHYPLTYY